MCFKSSVTNFLLKLKRVYYLILKGLTGISFFLYSALHTGLAASYPTSENIS